MSQDTVVPAKLAGVVKWFSITKRYGFIVPDGARPGEQDVLLTSGRLAEAGFGSSLVSGDRIEFEAMPNAKDPHKSLIAERVLAVVRADIPLSVPWIQKAQTQQQNLGGFELAECKLFFREKGFGFLTRGWGTPDIFVHMQILRQCGFPSGLTVGQQVLVKYDNTDRGLLAQEVRVRR